MDEFLDIICYPYLYLYVKTRVYVHQGKIHYLSWIVDMRKHYNARGCGAIVGDWLYLENLHS